MDYFDRLGAALEDAWSEHGRQEERFAAASVEVLGRLPPREAFERETLLDHLLDLRRTVPLQLAPLGAFGQPGFTVHHGHGFVVEVYHWLESLSAIHNHPFCGAFTILDGFSVHARYASEAIRALGGRARQVTLRLEGLELLEAGSIVPFSVREHPLVHALIHVPRSTISMVVRTLRTEGYYRYLPPSLAVPMEAEGEPRGRQITLLEGLAAADDPSHPRRLHALLDHADFELALRVLSSHWPRLDASTRQELIARLRPRLGPDAELLAPVLDRAERLARATALRESLHDPDLRLIAIALGYAEDREQVLKLLRARGLDPLPALHGFIRDADLFDESQEAATMVAHALIDGQSATDAFEGLRQAYGAATVADHESEIEDFCANSLFSALDSSKKSKRSRSHLG